MSNFGDHPAGFFGDSSFYNGVATQSLRFDEASTAMLLRTPSGAGNRRTFTISMWVKISDVVGTHVLINAFVSADPNNQGLVRFSSSKLQFTNFSGEYDLVTNRLFRDSSAWYHLVFAVDTTQGTAANRIKIYVNGVQETSFSTETYPDQNLEMEWNNTVKHLIGARTDNSTPSPIQRFDGYMAEVNLVDGTALDPTYFGQTKNGVWIPKLTSVTYGTNGFRLKFDQVGVGTASTSTIGADTSGNTHHFTSSGIAAHDCAMPDSPENNWCTLNVLEIDENNSGAALLEGNLKWTNINANVDSTFGFGTQGGKYYWEYLYVSSTDSNQYQGVTLQKDGISMTNAFNTGIALYFEDGTTRVDGTSGTGFGGKINADNIIQFKLDLDNGTLQFGKNNTYIDALTLPTSAGGWRAGGIQSGGTGGTRVFVANYGQDSSFAGTKTAQSNTDGNGNGNFFYAVPSGFLAVCSANLPEPTIGPNSASQSDDYFNTVLYTGNGGTKSITDVGFQPDWVWIKSRSDAEWHQLFDSSRGALERISSNETNAETTLANSLTSFNSDGFSLGSDGGNNGNNKTFVAWNWKANGAGSSGTTDTGALAVVNSAVPEAGFSIVTWTGNMGVDNISHGLSKAPEMMWLQNLSNANTPWVIWHKDLTADKMMAFNTSTEVDGYGQLGDDTNITVPTSTYFTVGNSNTSNATGKKIVNYCFHSVEGYCKVDSFISRQNTDGPFVYTGFKPAFVLAKMVVGGTSWRVMDNRRAGENQALSPHFLKPSDNNAEVTNEATTNFHANGFKMTFSGDVNYGTYKVIFIAFAETPFKYANAQ